MRSELDWFLSHALFFFEKNLTTLLLDFQVVGCLDGRIFVDYCDLKATVEIAAKA